MRAITLIVACCCWCCAGPRADRTASAEAAPRSAVGVRGAQFTIDAKPAFLLGISYFDALGKRAPDDADLDQIKAWGFRVVRVWAHWNTPVYGRDGMLTPEGRKRLDALATRLAARGLVLELVLLRPGQLPGQRFAAFASADARLTAVRELTTAMKPHRHVLFDLYNEHDHPDGPIDHDEARRIRDAVKAVDFDRVVTLSSTEYHFLDAAGSLTEAGGRALSDEVESVRVDALAPHFPRTPDWSNRTESRVATLRGALGRIAMPIYLNEEQRARTTEPAAAEYLTAVRGARRAGAAGWLFHTAAGYALDKRSLLAALRATERAALSGLAK